VWRSRHRALRWPGQRDENGNYYIMTGDDPVGNGLISGETPSWRTPTLGERLRSEAFSGAITVRDAPCFATLSGETCSTGRLHSDRAEKRCGRTRES
jgi:hypothetical protein